MLYGWVDFDVESSSDNPDGSGQAGVREVPFEKANVAISRNHDGTHTPLIDLDFPCRLVESSTPGHFHLYMDGVTVKDDDWDDVQQAMVAAGILQEGCYNRYKRDGTSVLRLPGVSKYQYYVTNGVTQLPEQFVTKKAAWEEAKRMNQANPTATNQFAVRPIGDPYKPGGLPE